MATAFQRLPGFRDFPPEELAVRSAIFDAWRRVSRRYGFQEYDGPPLEALELYVEKSGEEIVGQLYSFSDKGGREVTLRPEMTPSLARMLGERSRGMSKPIRWFSMPQLFRYERQQRGRLREHFQWNVDIVGEQGVSADAEVLAVGIDGVRALGLTAEDFYARVNDRRLLAALLGTIGVAADHVIPVFGVIDKVGRVPRPELEKQMAAASGLDSGGIDELLRLFDEPGLDALEQHYGERDGVAPELARLREYESILVAMGLGDFVEFDLTIVRGLAYYTGIVFELFDRERNLRAICGGGRYDRLLELVGGEPLPAVGFGMGDVVLAELLKDKGLLPSGERHVDYYIVSVGPEPRPVALRLAHLLRERGCSVLYPLRDRAVKKQFARAGQEGAREVLVLGSAELEARVVRVRDMGSGDEREVPFDDFGLGE